MVGGYYNGKRNNPCGFKRCKWFFFTIQLNANDKVLAFSFIGMKKQEIPVDDRSIINVTLASEANVMDEVVVIGYGSMKKSDLTGSVANVRSERLLDKPAFNVAEAISGKVAGVKIIQNNGAPGAGVTIRVRGTKSIPVTLLFLLLTVLLVLQIY